MRKVFLLICISLLAAVAFAQNKEVSGVVLSSEDNMPVIGASVVVDGNTTIGAATNVNGEFKFSVPASAKRLKVSYTGYKTVTVDIVSGKMKVVLSLDSEQLEDVVVTGYSKSTKRSFTGSANVVSAKDLAKKSVSNITQALNGEAPGITVINTSGQPGTSANIYVRGYGSLNGSTTPLYVVDGMPYSGSISAINPSDIESISLLKDAAATAIYGARGANGVVVITTKSGKRNESTSVTVEQKVGLNTRFLPRYDVLTSPEEYTSVVYQGLMQRQINAPTKDKQGNVMTPQQFANENIFLAKGKSGIGIPAEYNLWGQSANQMFDNNGNMKQGLKRVYDPESWYDYAFNPSLKSETNVSISGGGSKSSFFASVGYLNDKGYSINSSFERISARLNVNANPKTWLSTGVALNYSLGRSLSGGQSVYSSTNLFTFVDAIPPIYPLFLRDEKGEKIPDTHFGDYVFDYGNGRPFSTASNAVGDAVINKSKGEYHSTSFNGYVNINFLKNLVLENKIQGNIHNGQDISVSNPFYGQRVGIRGLLGKEYGKTLSFTGLNMLRYNEKFSSNNIEAFVAHEATYYRHDYDYVSKKNLLDPKGEHFNNAIQSAQDPLGYFYSYAIESYFGQVNYDYDNKYFLSATYRRDGASRFKNNKWGDFYSFGGAWVITSESFMKDVKWLKNLKLKASYGTLGNQGVPAGLDNLYMYYSGDDLYDLSNIDGNFSFVLNKKGNPDLTWEKSSMTQVGLEFNVANYLEGSIDWYYKYTSDMLYTKRVAPSNGYALYMINAGKIRNTGFDFELTAHLYKSKNAFVDLRLNGGYLNNKILEMPFDEVTGKQIPLDESITGIGRAAGHSVFDHYMPTYMGVNPKTGEAQYKLWYYDENGNGVYDAKEEISSLPKYIAEHPDRKNSLKEDITTKSNLATNDFVGKSSLPKLRGGFAINTGFYGFDFSMQFSYALGGYGYDGVYANLMRNSQPGANNFHKDIQNRWKQEGDKTDIPRYNAGLDNNTTIRSTRFLTKSDYLNLSNIRLGYSIPKSLCGKLGLTDVNIWVSGDNVFLISARKGYNPMTSISGGSSSYTYTPLTTFISGLRITF